ncbi:hypothetical protein [Nocardioides caldifontis]|uniref:hypothetical protein n=1 Tax=Nocardioides caldifontis TaxID=2588938 RepID=UPI0011DF0E91|nr:hypothetical protein [Nocardioides caldifontis]
MRNLSRTLAVAAATVAITVPSFGAAQAAGNDWKTLSTFDGGKVQACKVATKSGDWKVKLRVDARKAKSKVTGMAYVTKNGDELANWTSGWVKKGKVSSVGTVKLPRGKAYTLDAGIGGTNAGNGASFKAKNVPGC